MADGGWIKVYRKIRQSFVWTDANQLKLWLLILMKANHAPSKFLFNGQEVSVTSGELVTGAHALAFEMNDGVRRDNQVSWRQVWRWVKKFENSGMLTIKSNTKYSVISISKWYDYQDNDNQVSIKRQSTVNQLSTNKKEEKEKKEKKEDSQHSRKREYADDSPELIEAVYLWEKIKGNNPEHRKPDLQSWADDIRKMNQLDHHPFEKIHKMIDWCQIDTFWQTNILSASKLRSKYDTMAAQANRPYTSRRAPARQEATPEWMQEGYQPPKQEFSAEDKAELAEKLKELKQLRSRNATSS